MGKKNEHLGKCQAAVSAMKKNKGEERWGAVFNMVVSHEENVEQMKTKKYGKCSCAWWFTAVILALERLTQNNSEFKVSLGSMARPCLKK
jgi:hypothetical protein